MSANGRTQAKDTDSEGIGTERIDRFVDQHRSRCLWFLHPSYYPETLEARLRVLRWIQEHGDTEAFREAAAIRQWLLQSSKPDSAAS